MWLRYFAFLLLLRFSTFFFFFFFSFLHLYQCNTENEDIFERFDTHTHRQIFQVKMHVYFALHYEMSWLLFVWVVFFHSQIFDKFFELEPNTMCLSIFQKCVFFCDLITVKLWMVWRLFDLMVILTRVAFNLQMDDPLWIAWNVTTVWQTRTNRI